MLCPGGLAPFYRPAICAVQTAQELRIVHGAVLGLPLDFTDLVLILHTQFIQSVLQDALPIHLNTHVTPLCGFPFGACCPLEATYTTLLFCCSFAGNAQPQPLRENGEPIRRTPDTSGPTPSPCGSAGACNEHRSISYWVLTLCGKRQKRR
jgi:hypothetical protein